MPRVTIDIPPALARQMRKRRREINWKQVALNAFMDTVLALDHGPVENLPPQVFRGPREAEPKRSRAK